MKEVLSRTDFLNLKNTPFLNMRDFQIKQFSCCWSSKPCAPTENRTRVSSATTKCPNHWTMEAGNLR